MSDEAKRGSTTRTLTEEEILTEKPRDIGRRDAVSLFGVVAAGAVAFATGCRRRVHTVQVVQSAITDNDRGPCSDPINGGRGVSGITDSDTVGCADPVNRGRGGGRVVQVQPVYQQGITDRDGGPCADPGGGGRGYSGLTDSDGGYCSDPGGRGRTGY